MPACCAAPIHPTRAEDEQHDGVSGAVPRERRSAMRKNGAQKDARVTRGAARSAARFMSERGYYFAA